MYRQMFSQNDTEPQEAAPETPGTGVLTASGRSAWKRKTQDQTKLNFHYNLWETEKGGQRPDTSGTLMQSVH